MNYPVWDIPIFGGGLLVALIATVHVYISHFAVGGGLFLVMTETKARREKDNPMLDYVRRHTRFFLLITMVLGALTGVGIWLVISVLNPSATSVMIHLFVFGWATEWVFFIVEIVALLVYYYTFRNMAPRNHIIVGWIYFIAAWLSLFVIDGIISFMLTSGKWPETGTFWAALLNPSFMPSLIFRTAIALILAGVYGLITSTSIKEADLRQKMVRYCVLWLILPFIILLPSGFWYLQVIPEQAKDLILGDSPETGLYRSALIWLTIILILAGLFITTRLGAGIQKLVAFGLLIIAFLFLGSFEMVREAGRRPFIIYNHMYSNSILCSSLASVQEKGVLKSATWARSRYLESPDPTDSGKEIFNLLCLPCHSMGGYRNNIMERIRDMGYDDLLAIIGEMGQDKGFMPPFPGTGEEGEILVRYLFDIHYF
ncbi:MAG: cytochrome ubiquinol oxidase subunit I [Deltaproteobacteria bacterium]|nr:cytochrome ubiquinol oxidase subunit I [Deltaproteobacteria bacterium]